MTTALYTNSNSVRSQSQSGASYNDPYSSERMSNSVARIAEQNRRLGAEREEEERLRLEEEQRKKGGDNSTSKGMDAYNKYKKYSKNSSGAGGESLTTASGEGVTQLGGETPYMSQTGQFAVDESLSLGGESAGMGSEAVVEMAPESSYTFGGSGGESGGMGSAAYVAAIIYGADQAKKKWGGYEKTNADMKLGADGYYHKQDANVAEIPWDEKTYMQKSADAPASIGGAGGLFTNFAEEDTAVGKFGKEMARIEEQAFEPISKFISWLGLDL
jgi:hypothetical protein